MEPTLDIRPAGDRGLTKLQWLDSRHSFSFGDYYDPEHMGFGKLRVINDDRVFPDGGFGTHPHRDMEILSFVVEGALEHSDSLGNGSVIRAGDVQRMTAGTGIQHSEFNPSSTEEVRFLQVWIEPERRGLQPGYEQRAFDLESVAGTPVLIASRDGRDGSLTVHQDVEVFRVLVPGGGSTDHRLAEGRRLWLQVVSAEVEVAGHPLQEGDGAALAGGAILDIVGRADMSDLLLFELA